MGSQELRDSISFGGAIWRFTLVVGVFFGISMVIIVIVTSIKEGDKNAIKDEPVKSISEKDEILNSLKLDYKWSKTRFGNVMEVDLAINNQSDYNIKDIKIICHLYGKSGTTIDEVNAIIYDIVKKNSKKKINDFNMGFIHSQANSAACEVIDFKINL